MLKNCNGTVAQLAAGKALKMPQVWVQIPSVLPFLKAGVALLIGIFVYVFTTHCVIKLGKIDGPSMFPTYREGDTFYVKAYELFYRNPKRNEIVVLKDIDGIEVIKRVVLIPGDFDIYSPHHKVLVNNEYVVLGDNRTNSLDSRDYGPIKRHQLLGIVD